MKPKGEHDVKAWDCGDLDIPTDQLEWYIQKVVDENVEAALRSTWKEVNISIMVEDDGEPEIHVWGPSSEEWETQIVPLRDLGGWEAINSGSEASRKIANIFESLAERARHSADQWDKDNPDDEAN